METATALTDLTGPTSPYWHTIGVANDLMQRPSSTHPPMQDLDVLLVEARDADAELIAAILSAPGRNLRLERVQSEGTMRAALEKRPFDVVIADYKLPSFDASAALAVLRELDLDVPLIVVSSEVGEDAAVETMRQGARDFILKANLSRLAPAIEREVRSGQARRERRDAEAQLRKETMRRQILMGASLDGICIINQRHEVVEANRRFGDMLGYSPEEVQHLHTWDWDATMTEAEIREAFVDLQTTAAVFETRHRRKDGSIYDAEVSAAGTLVGGEALVFTVSRDITARKRAERALAESEERFRGIFQSATDGILVTETESGQVIMANHAMCAMLGSSEDELLRMQLADICPDGQGPRSTEDCHGGHPHHLAKGVSLRRKDGTCLLADVSSVSLEFGGRRCRLSLYRDMTAFNEMETQLRHSQKIEAIGQLAGGVAHDFNNILGVILGHCEIALTSPAPDGPLRESLQQIQAGAQRATALTRQLLAFSRKQTLQPKVLDLNAIVEGLENMVRRLIGADIVLSLDLAPKLSRVKVDPGQLEQVIINLVVNARDAMPTGGSLQIRTADLDLEAAQSREGAHVPAGRYATLCITDTGVGMTRETQERLFEPFFTTKEKGKGTGLGLSTAYGIVKQSGGYIWARSQPGEGATFEVHLPRTPDPLEPRTPPAAEAQPVGRHEMILIVEDEPALRGLVQNVLIQRGYRTAVAANGVEAFAAVRTGRVRPDLVITDVVMPEMGGPALVERLHEVHPDLKVLFMSGYPDADSAHRGSLPHDAPFIQKPFRIADLAAKVAQALRATHD